jgi:hypothetical protein
MLEKDFPNKWIPKANESALFIFDKAEINPKFIRRYKNDQFILIGEQSCWRRQQS